MTSFTRGDIVARDGARAVVWSCAPDPFTVLPIVRAPDVQLAHDVPIELMGDLLLCRVSAGAVIRVAGLTSSTMDRQAPSGRLSRTLLARIELAMARAQREAVIAARWTRDREHRRIALPEQTALRGL